MLSTQVLLSLALAAASSVVGTIDNSKAESTLTAAAITLAEGDYTFTNGGTGAALSYIQSGQQLFPGSGSGDPVTLAASSDGPYMALQAGTASDMKCLSAQWGYNEAGQGVGADAAGVLYACTVGPNSISGSTVNPDKQWWLFVPVANQTLASVGLDNNSGVFAAGTNGTCAKSQAWVQRHPQYINGPVYFHPECASLLRADQLKAVGLSKRGNDIIKRQSTAPSSGTFNIIALDHLTDMPTRALTGSVSVIGGSKTTSLELYDPTDANQMWTIAPVSSS